MKYKKFWILYDGEEIIEKLDTEYKANYSANIHSGDYFGDIGTTSGYYIMIPIDRDVAGYRSMLIKDLILRQNIIIEKANNKMVELSLKL
ncbi:MAG TPA: hypothetical protein VIM70_20445 [Clostridium sp.]|uniref:hypothetical protein n=1 Tax=Clostridium sp. TaxID=1506 RepID=UPI002F935779